MADIAQAAEAAAEAAATTAEVVEAIEASADAAIEAAQDRAEAAEELAEDIAEAALESERGRRVAELQEAMASCLNNLQAVQNQLAEMQSAFQSEMSALSNRLLEAEAKLGAPQFVALLSPSIPPMSPDPMQVPTPEAVAIPLNPSESGAAVSPVQQTAQRRARRLI